MRRAVAVAIALGLSAPAPALAGEVYMGMTAGPSPSGHGGGFDATFSPRGHVALDYVFGLELKDLTVDLVFGGAGYSVRDKPPPADAVLLWGGVRVGRQLWLGRDVALGAFVGLHGAKMVRWSDADDIPMELQVGGTAWTVGARLEYVLGRMPPAAGYHGPIRMFDAAIVVEARRDRMFLSSDSVRVEPTLSIITAGLRFGMML